MADQGLTLEQKLRYLEVDLLKLRAENTRLRKALKENGRHSRRVERAYEDALLLATWQAAGIIPSRRYAKIKGMSQNRWENATALLKLARIITRQRHWTTDNLAVIEKRLETARERATADPPLFFLRANSHCKRGHED